MKQKWLTIAVASLFLATPVMAQMGNGQNTYYQKVYDKQTNKSYLVPVSSKEMQTKSGINEYGISANDFMFSVQGGYARSTNKVEDGLAWGKKGGYVLGASGFFFPTSVIGVGLEYNGIQFSKEKTESYCWGPMLASCIKGTSQVRMDNVMFALRLNVNPSHRVRFYVPLGAGIDFLKVKETVSGAVNLKENRTYRDFAWYAGVGLESSITRNFLLGIEARINGSHDTHRDGGDRLIYATGLAKIGFKF